MFGPPQFLSKSETFNCKVTEKTGDQVFTTTTRRVAQGDILTVCCCPMFTTLCVHKEKIWACKNYFLP